MHIIQAADADLKQNEDEDMSKARESKTPKRVGWKLLGDQRVPPGGGGAHEPDLLRLASAAGSSRGVAALASSSSMRPEPSLKQAPSHVDRHRTSLTEDHASDK